MKRESTPAGGLPPIPAALLSANPGRWLSFFGPGAVIASLTIGVGELVFSSRAGAIFGYRLLGFFVLVLALKWVLVFGSARHIVLTGAHPIQRWMDLPGPRGWLPLVFLLLAVPCFPIWVCFHAGTVGTLLSSLAGTETALRGGAELLWGAGVLAVVLGLCAVGGHRALERIQLVIVLLMLGSVAIAALALDPAWLEMVKGLFLPQSLDYPTWLTIESHREVASRPVWLEVTTYVGVIGGSSYDYLAYVSYLRDKHWGRAGRAPASRAELEAMGATNMAAGRRWLRAPLIDCTLSFAAVLAFVAVFVICGAEVLGPQHKVPGGSNLLSLQAEFVTALHPWLKHVYFAGAFLAVLGTLYGTIEVAPAILREMAAALGLPMTVRVQRRVRLWSVAWVGLGGLVILLWSFGLRFSAGVEKPPGLIAILTPANLFTGVLGCGLICLGNEWMERRFLPKNWRAGLALRLLSAFAAVVFTGLGLKASWDHSGWLAFGILAATIAAGMVGAVVWNRFGRSRIAASLPVDEVGRS